MYIDVARKIPCRAKDPKRCRFHGALLKMDEALARGDRSGYLRAREQMEAAAVLMPEAAEFVEQLEREQAELNARLDEQARFDAIWDAAIEDERATRELRVTALEQSTDPDYLAAEWRQLAAAAPDGVPAVDGSETYALLLNPYTPQRLVVGYVEDLDALQAEGLLTDAPGRLPADIAARLLTRHGLAHNNAAIAYAAISHLDVERAQALAFTDEGTFTEFLVHHGWVDNPVFEENVMALVRRRDLDRDDWSQTLPALGRHARGEAAQLLVAQRGNAQARRDLAANDHLGVAAAAALVANADDFDLTNYDQLREQLGKNTALPQQYRALFATSDVTPVAGAVSGMDMERLEHARASYVTAKQATQELWQSTGKEREHWLAADRVEERERVAYLNALAAVDAHQESFELLQAGKGNAMLRRGLRRQEIGVPQALAKDVFIPYRLQAAKNYLLQQQDMRAGFLLV